MTGVPAYQPRRFSHCGLWIIDGLSCKTYTIEKPGCTTVETSLRDRARDYLEDALPGLRQREGEDHGLGYVIVHAGEQRNWLLAHWWAHQDIVLAHLASSGLQSTQFESQDHRAFHACVWEHVVIDHERNAWVSEMMREGGNSADYLSAALTDGHY